MIIKIEMLIDMVQYGETESPKAALALAKALMKGEADWPDRFSIVIMREPPYINPLTPSEL
jgi:hypothetical protein